MPPVIGRLLGLIAVFTRCGQRFFRELAQPGATINAGMARYYGSAEVEVVLRYLLRGWLRAGALAELLRRRALRGLDLGQPGCRGPVNRKPGAGRRGGCRTPAQPAWGIPFTDRVPGQEELIAWVRRRSIDAVLAAIARDLALLPEQLGTAAWEKMQQSILAYAGDAAQPLIARMRKLRPVGAASAAAAEPAPGSEPACKRRPPHPQPGQPAPLVTRVLLPVQELLRIALQASTGPPLLRPAQA